MYDEREPGRRSGSGTSFLGVVGWDGVKSYKATKPVTCGTVTAQREYFLYTREFGKKITTLLCFLLQGVHRYDELYAIPSRCLNNHVFAYRVIAHTLLPFSAVAYPKRT